jgi:methylenetetrahydrofolate dehydrogenase (NADP+)/methenyltetrahydrofolate cyclohydrolase
MNDGSNILNGKAVAETLKAEIRERVKQLLAAGQKPPHLAAVLVGNDGGSETYVGHKVSACKEVGFASSLLRFPSDISEEELLEVVKKLNEDNTIDGFIVQLPLPGHIDSNRILQAVAPHKDVDGFHPENVGKLMLGLPTFLSATPKGIMTLLERYGISPEGMHCVIIGRSNIVGRPLSILLSQANATVTVCHSRTKELERYCREADLLIAALGKPGFVTANMVKKGAIVIDVGTTRVDDPAKKSGWRLCGDVDYEKVAPKCRWITPVPGGVGPMTVISLLKNTLEAKEKSQ